jgi:ankyrin repeat protein
LTAPTQEGADPAAVDPDSRRTALHHAAIGGSARCAAALLTHRGGDAWRLVDARTAGGFAPLHFAALYGYAPVARVLIAAGARVMLPTSNQDGLGDLRTVVCGSTPLVSHARPTDARPSGAGRSQ